MEEELNKLTDAELQKQIDDLNSPGAWDYDADASYTRNYFLCALYRELGRRK